MAGFLQELLRRTSQTEERQKYSAERDFEARGGLGGQTKNNQRDYGYESQCDVLRLF